MYLTEAAWNAYQYKHKYDNNLNYQITTNRYYTKSKVKDMKIYFNGNSTSSTDNVN
jgi:hypothetical protein